MVHFLTMLCFFAPAASSPDANGYLVQARLLSETGKSWFALDSPLQYVGGQWVEGARGRFFSRHPPGLPVLEAVLFTAFGPRGAFLLNPVLTSLSLLGLFLLGWKWR